MNCRFVFTFRQAWVGRSSSHLQISLMRTSKKVKGLLHKNLSGSSKFEDPITFCTTLDTNANSGIYASKQVTIQAKAMVDGREFKGQADYDLAACTTKTQNVLVSLKMNEDFEIKLRFDVEPFFETVSKEKEKENAALIKEIVTNHKSTKIISWAPDTNEPTPQKNVNQTTRDNQFRSIKTIGSMNYIKSDAQIAGECPTCIKNREAAENTRKRQKILLERLNSNDVKSMKDIDIDDMSPSCYQLFEIKKENESMHKMIVRLEKQVGILTQEKSEAAKQAAEYLSQVMKEKEKLMTVLNIVIEKCGQNVFNMITNELCR